MSFMSTFAGIGAANLMDGAVLEPTATDACRAVSELGAPEAAIRAANGGNMATKPATGAVTAKRGNAMLTRASGPRGQPCLGELQETQAVTTRTVHKHPDLRPCTAASVAKPTWLIFSCIYMYIYIHGERAL